MGFSEFNQPGHWRPWLETVDDQLAVEDDFISGKRVRKLCETCKKNPTNGSTCSLTIKIDLKKIKTGEIWCNLFYPDYPEFIYEWRKKLELEGESSGD